VHKTQYITIIMWANTLFATPKKKNQLLNHSI